MRWLDIDVIFCSLMCPDYGLASSWMCSVPPGTKIIIISNQAIFQINLWKNHFNSLVWFIIHQIPLFESTTPVLIPKWKNEASRKDIQYQYWTIHCNASLTSCSPCSRLILSKIHFFNFLMKIKLIKIVWGRSHDPCSLLLAQNKLTKLLNISAIACMTPTGKG